MEWIQKNNYTMCNIICIPHVIYMLLRICTKMMNYNNIDNHVVNTQDKKSSVFGTFEISYVLHVVILLLPGGNHYPKFWVIILFSL